MEVSERRLAANRANALKSTGPKTAEGKAISRANGLKHGLCASVCVPESLELVRERHTEFFYSLKPRSEYQVFLVDQAALASVRIDRCERIERRVRDKIALRAELTWDDDRRMEAEAIGKRLAADPAGTVEALRRTPHGCEWLMTRWAMLAYVADAKAGHWTDEQKAMAFDLLATPRPFREGIEPGISIDFDGRPMGVPAEPASVARRMVAELKERREVVADLDEVERALTMADLTNDSDRELKNLRRYESALHTRLRWSVEQIQKDDPGRRIGPNLFPRWKELPAKTEEEKLAEAHPADSPHPPFDLEPDEYPPLGQKADIPAIIASRKQKRAAKSDARRAAKRRRIDELRA